MVKEYPVIENRNTTTTATVTVTSSPSKALEVNLINLTNEVILHHWNEKNHDLSLALDLNAKNKDDNVAFTISNFKVTANPESPAYGDYDKSLKEFKITNIISGGKAKATSGKAKATESPTHDTSDKKSFILPYVQPGQISCNVCFQTMGITVEFTLKNSWRFYTQKINHLIFDDGKILKPEAIIIQ